MNGVLANLIKLFGRYFVGSVRSEAHPVPMHNKHFSQFQLTAWTQETQNGDALWLANEIQYKS